MLPRSRHGVTLLQDAALIKCTTCNKPIDANEKLAHQKSCKSRGGRAATAHKQRDEPPPPAAPVRRIAAAAVNPIVAQPQQSYLSAAKKAVPADAIAAMVEAPLVTAQPVQHGTDIDVLVAQIVAQIAALSEQIQNLTAEIAAMRQYHLTDHIVKAAGGLDPNSEHSVTVDPQKTVNNITVNIHNYGKKDPVVGGVTFDGAKSDLCTPAPPAGSAVDEITDKCLAMLSVDKIKFN